MTLSALFKWKNADSTTDMNQRLQTLVPRGIFDGGDVTAGAGLTVVVSAAKALSYDGMLVLENTVQTLGVVAGNTNYIVIRAKYVSGSTPTVQWEVMDQAVYNLDPDRNYLIVFGVVTLAAGAVAVAPANISMLERDVVDPMQRSPYRGNTVLANLPTPPPTQNRDGDFYFVTDQETFYWWNVATLTWQAFTTGSYNVETGSMVDVVVRGERDRIENGSGVIGGVRPADGFASEPDITLIETASVANQIGFDTFSCVINGHYVQPHARYVTLAAKPGALTRYDLIFLEAYRETITVPENHDFPRNPDGTLTYTITEVSDQVEQILFEAGVGGNNFDLNELQSDDHSWVVTKYRIGTVEGVALNSLGDNQNAAFSALNVDGNFFAPTAVAPHTGTDERVWVADSTTSSDGYSWAIPLFVVKRTVAEDHIGGHAVQIFRDDLRWVFPVYASADSAQAARLNVDTVARQQPFNYSTESPVDYTQPSGFINGLDYEFTFTDPNKIRIYEDEVRVRIRGLEDNFRFNGGPNFEVAGAPAAGYERTLVWLKMCYTRYCNDPTQTGVMISKRHRPLISDKLSLSGFKGIGWKRGYVTYELEYYNLGAAATELDEHDAMTTAGWTKGDASIAALGLQYADGGIWSKAVTTLTDERVAIFGYEWAVPVCLIHRRNKAIWSWSTNPNGTTATRPDGKAIATLIDTDDTLDLRRLVDVDEARLAEMLESDIDKLMRGQLRTRMAERWAGTVGVGGSVAGTRLLQSDHTNAVSVAHRLAAPDGTRKVWSDAKEFVPVATSFPLNANVAPGADPYVTYTVASGVLIIKAPPGAHLVRNLPSSFFVDSNAANATYLQFKGEPCWSTQSDHTLGYPSPCTLKWINAVTGNIEEQNVFDADLGMELCPSDEPAFTISASDTLGHATQMSITLTDLMAYGSADIMAVSFWVHYPRNTTGVEYISNAGLAEIPDEVYSIYKDPNGVPVEINIGTIYTTVRTIGAIASVVVITSADVLAASGTSGTTATIVGFDTSSITYSAAPGVTLASATLDAAQTTLTLTFTGPIAPGIGIDVVVYYFTDVVSEWVEVGRGSKSVRAYYSWHEENIDLLTTPPAQTYAFDLATSIWHDAEVGGRMAAMPIVWESTVGVGGPWTYVAALADVTAGYRYSNIVSFDANAFVLQRYCKVVVPRWQAPAASAADAFVIHYSATPYQGLSSTGGAVAVPATAVPKLKKMLHGTIEANSQHVVTQSGACSIFGGVNSWSGVQARYPQTYRNFDGGRFRQYNQTQLVKSTKANGSSDLGPGSGAAEAMYAAAVLRLPYPANPAMLDPGGLYYDPTMDWDLDPGREGAGSGYMCMAPGYWSGLSFLNMTNGLHYDQFVNSLSRLAVAAGPLRKDLSTLVPASAFQPQADSTGYAYAATNEWTVPASKIFAGDAPITNARGTVPLLVTSRIDNLDATDINSVATTNYSGVIFSGPIATYKIGATIGAYFANAVNHLYTAPFVLDGTTDVLLCTVPGTAQEYYYRTILDVYPFVNVDIRTTVTVAVRKIGQSLIVQDGPMQHGQNNTGGVSNESRVVDTIRLPLGSSSHGANAPASPDLESTLSASSLRGRVVQYPASWGAATETALEALWAASIVFHAGYGRGLYLGTTTNRYNAPMMIPGSGTPIFTISRAENIQAEQTAQPPDQYPTASSVSPFASSVRANAKYDHGGPLGYSFYGVIINPDDDDYTGQAVMQISGGPTGPRVYTAAVAPVYNSDELDGSALDSMWPSKRPLLRTK